MTFNTIIKRNTLHNDTKCLFVVSYYAECHHQAHFAEHRYSDYRFAAWHYAACRYAECRGAWESFKVFVV